MPQVKFLSQVSPLLHKASPGDPQLASELTRQYILQVHRVQPSELREALLAELKAKTTKPDEPSREPLKPGRCATSAPPFARHGGKTSCSCSLSRPLGGHFAQHRTRNGEHSSGPSSRNSGCGCTRNLGTWHRGSWCRSRCRAWCVCRRWCRTWRLFFCCIGSGTAADLSVGADFAAVSDCSACGIVSESSPAANAGSACSMSVSESVLLSRSVWESMSLMESVPDSRPCSSLATDPLGVTMTNDLTNAVVSIRTTNGYESSLVFPGPSQTLEVFLIIWEIRCHTSQGGWI